MKKVIFPFSEKNPRCGEGCTVLLKDGRVFMVTCCFTGGADHSYSFLMGAYLDPETGEMSEVRRLFDDSHFLNQMSVSLERLNDGSIGIIFLRKLSAHHDLVLFARSFDECRTWSEAKVISYVNHQDYYVVNNDRLRQLRSGRLVVPVCVYPAPAENFNNSYLQLWYSDDMGETWNTSEEIKPCPNPPKPEPYAAVEPWENIVSNYKEQEPGVEEAPDGTLYYYCRTILGYMYQAFSKDQGKTFTCLEPQKDIIAPLSPQTIRREPGTERMWCVYNDRSGVTFGDGDNHWGWRTPLTLAYSDDNGHSWKKYEEIEDDSHNYCYMSMTFIGKKMLLTYYESENREDGTRRNLGSLKMQTVMLP
jgi:hypothetical protein